MRSMNVLRPIGLTVLLLAPAGCSKEGELQSIAKDWCMTIRASQVIPVYPLTEDLEPGDVFLVTTPIQRQAEQYRTHGFLPLDMHLVRLDALNYEDFYRGSHGSARHRDVVDRWKFPPRSAEPGGNQSDANRSKGGEAGLDPGAPNRHRERTDWGLAPRAVFPSYSFTVRRGLGLAAAFPVKGIPVALSLTHADAATGTVSIGDAYSYGVTLEELEAKVHEWAIRPDVLGRLSTLHDSALGPWWICHGRQQLYVRVVARVYLAGHVAVSLVDARAGGGEAAAGKSPPQTTVLALDVQDANRNYDNVLANLNRSLDASMPGGRLSIAYATRRGVTVSEVFDRPVVIGYLGFDFPVLEGGLLGPAVATREHLLGIPQPKGGAYYRDQYEMMRLLINTLAEDAQAEAYAGAAAKLGGAFDETFKQQRSASRSPSQAFGLAYIETRAKLRREFPVDAVCRALVRQWEKHK